VLARNRQVTTLIRTRPSGIAAGVVIIAKICARTGDRCSEEPVAEWENLNARIEGDSGCEFVCLLTRRVRLRDQAGKVVIRWMVSTHARRLVQGSPTIIQNAIAESYGSPQFMRTLRRVL
jgi:hypothetical protein